ncbi:methylcobalamin:coenzyme M methyltransferase [Oxobacter pfennigii]|uniref:Methylcobalamin:coenzyme M methyltransferase n=1 Tax=Oxobacter pfennigii TaxID=36849 RepID=A0A0P8W7V7_9CLOT|nr:uroporphyrinogen decarboxylase family protein [Oxobacter pfennigii]KPU43849.1 methylcobalamin:coenzyme M methyltransferase [Oxobacter pfennigii]
MKSLRGKLKEQSQLYNTMKKPKVLAQITDHALALSGISGKRYYSDPAALTEIQLLAYEYYSIFPSWIIMDVYNIEAQLIGQSMKYLPNGMPDIDQGNPLIKTQKDLCKIKLPGNFPECGRIPLVLESLRLMEVYTGLIPVPAICAPFSMACGIRGYARLIRDIKTRPKFAHQLLKTITDGVTIPYLKIIIEKNPEVANCCLADAWGSLPNITPQIFDEFIAPYIERIRDSFKNIQINSQAYWGIRYAKDLQSFLEKKLPIEGEVIAYGDDARAIGLEFFKNCALKQNKSIIVGIESLLINEGHQEDLIWKVKEQMKICSSLENVTFLLEDIPATAPSENIHAVTAAIKAYSRAQAPKDYDTIRVGIPERETFPAFVRQKQRENPDGYTFSWIDEANLIK